jgi:hypothetical protein
MINIMKGLIETDKIKPYIKEFVEKGYNKMINSAIVSTADKEVRVEEEKKMLAHEKGIAEQEKYDSYKDKRHTSNGTKGYGSHKYVSNKSNTIDLKPSIPKATISSVNLKKSIKKKKHKDTTPTGKVKIKTKVSDKSTKKSK